MQWAYGLGSALVISKQPLWPTSSGILNEQFSEIQLFAIEENLFLSEGTKECSVVLFADGYQQASTEKIHSVRYCATFKAFRTQLLAALSAKGAAITSEHDMRCARTVARQKLQRSTLTPRLQSLGTLGRINIGVVTGDMKTFMLSMRQVHDLSLSNASIQTCLIRSKEAPGLVLTDADIKALDSQDVPTKLLTLQIDKPLSNVVKRHLEHHWPELSATENATFRKRSIWYVIPKQTPPEGIISYFAANGPRLIINACNAAATNSMFCLWLNSNIAPESKPLILASISLSLLSGIGRSYTELNVNRFGNGAVKLGVGTLNQMPVIIANTTEHDETMIALKYADNALRKGGHTAAAQIANRWLLSVSKSPRIVQDLESAAASLFNARAGHGS